MPPSYSYHYQIQYTHYWMQYTHFFNSIYSLVGHYWILTCIKKSLPNYSKYYNKDNLVLIQLSQFILDNSKFDF